MLAAPAPTSLVDRVRLLWRQARPPGGWIFRDARFLAARVEVDPRAASGVLPRGLRLADPARATVFTAHFPEASFGSAYNEAAVFLHVRRGRRTGLHCPWILVDDDIALIAGRELLGYPKKLGTIDFVVENQRVRSRVVRKHTCVLEMDAELGAIDPEPPAMEGLPTFNVLGTIGWSLQRLVAFEPREQVLESRVASCALTIHRAERDPIHELGFGRVVSAHFYRVNLGTGSAIPRPVAAIAPTFFIRTWMLRYR